MHELRDKTFLVTGGAGNLGSYVVEALIREAARRVVVVDNFYNGHQANLDAALESTTTETIVVTENIADHDRLLAVFNRYRPDYVFNMASMLTLDCRAEPLRAIQYNIVGTYNVIDCSIRTGVTRLVHSSSASVFGEPRYLPVDEQHPFDNKLLYGATKIANEALLNSAHHEYGLSWVGLRYYNVFSERQRRGHLYTQVIPKWAHEIATQGTLTINDDGSQTMDLIHAEDIARANILALRSDVVNEVLNIGSGIETSVKQLAQWMIELYEMPVKIVYQDHDPNRVKRRASSTERAEQVLGFRAQISAREGIRRCVEVLKSRELSAVAFDDV
jgi:UDP-glucose 4-epimerase